MGNRQRIYDIKEYSEKVRGALLKLEASEQPASMNKGGKIEVLEAVKIEIRALLEKGYEPQQIAQALKTDVFTILPKTVVEIAGMKKEKPKRERVAKAASSSVS